MVDLPVENPIPLPGTFQLDSLEIRTSTGASVDLKFIASDLNIYMDIFANCITGDITVKDSINYPSLMQLHGNEYLFISFKTNVIIAENDNKDYPGITRVFRIYKLSDKNFVNNNTYTYKIHFCSEEFVLNQQIRISKSYKNVSAGDIVSDIMNNTLGISSKKLRRPTTSGEQYSLIIPNMRPLEAINWIASISRDSNLNSTYLFFENASGYNFKSLSSLYYGNVRRQISITNKDVLEPFSEQTVSVADAYKVKKQFDILDLISSGGAYAKLINMDLTTRTQEISVSTAVDEKPMLNDNFLFNSARNRRGYAIYNDSAYVRYFPTYEGNVTGERLVQRASQLAALTSNIINVVIPGDSELDTGDIIDIYVPNILGIDEESEPQDNISSGKYLVTAVRHRIFNEKYLCYVELCRDSSLTAYAESVETNNPYTEFRRA
jgi:hypothetical protein